MKKVLNFQDMKKITGGRRLTLSNKDPKTGTTFTTFNANGGD